MTHYEALLSRFALTHTACRLLDDTLFASEAMHLSALRAFLLVIARVAALSDEEWCVTRR